MDLKTCQLCMLRAVNTKGWPADLVEHLLSRCGAETSDWTALLLAGLVTTSSGRHRLTVTGRRALRSAARARVYY